MTPSRRSVGASVDDRIGRSLRVRARACTPAIPSIPALQPTPASRPFATYKAAVAMSAYVDPAFPLESKAAVARDSYLLRDCMRSFSEL